MHSAVDGGGPVEDRPAGTTSEGDENVVYVEGLRDLLRTLFIVSLSRVSSIQQYRQLGLSRVARGIVFCRTPVQRGCMDLKRQRACELAREKKGCIPCASVNSYTHTHTCVHTTMRAYGRPAEVDIVAKASNFKRKQTVRFAARDPTYVLLRGCEILGTLPRHAPARWVPGFIDQSRRLEYKCITAKKTASQQSKDKALISLT